jgi:hypothetical protein
LTDGFVEVDEVILQGEVQRLHRLDVRREPRSACGRHAVYDVWLVDRKGAVTDTNHYAAAAPRAREPRSSVRARRNSASRLGSRARTRVADVGGKPPGPAFGRPDGKLRETHRRSRRWKA